MHDIDSALQVIQARDATAARLANGLWGAMRAHAAHPRVTRYDVQVVCWGAMPLLARNPERAALLGDRHAAAEALAELLELLGYPRYAEICRGETTRRILDAAEDADACTALEEAAWRESGIRPPDTPVLRWGEVRGPIEQAVHGATGRIMEEAIEHGTLDPASPNAEQVKTGLTMHILRSPAEGLPGTWFSQIFTERLDTWLTCGTQTRRELLVRVRPEVERVPEIDPCADLPALRLLLDACQGDGVRLTRSGYLPTELVADVVELMPSCHGKPPARGESRWPQVVELRRLAGELNLVHLAGSRLRLTELGRTCADDLDTLIMAVGEGMVSRDATFQGVVEEVVFAVLLLEDELDLARLQNLVTVVIEEGYERADNVPDACREWAKIFLSWLYTLDVLDVDVEEGVMGLTEGGRAVARWALRARVMLREVPAE